MFIPKCFQCCQHKLGMCIMQFTSSSSPKSGQFSEEAPRNRIVCIIHNAGSKINSCSSPARLQSTARSHFDTVNLARMMCFSAEPTGRYSQVNKDDNEVAAFGPENTTWEPFLLGGSSVQTEFSRRKTTVEVLYIPGGHGGKVFTTEHQASGVVHPPPLLSPSPSGAHQVLRQLNSWGFWFCHQEGMACRVLLGKQNQIRTMMDLSDVTRWDVYL